MYSYNPQAAYPSSIQRNSKHLSVPIIISHFLDYSAMKFTLI